MDLKVAMYQMQTESVLGVIANEEFSQRKEMMLGNFWLFGIVSQAVVSYLPPKSAVSHGKYGERFKAHTCHEKPSDRQ